LKPIKTKVRDRRFERTFSALPSGAVHNWFLQSKVSLQIKSSFLKSNTVIPASIAGTLLRQISAGSDLYRLAPFWLQKRGQNQAGFQSYVLQNQQIALGDYSPEKAGGGGSTSLRPFRGERKSDCLRLRDCEYEMSWRLLQIPEFLRVFNQQFLHG
jgi:hypothetical protein